MDELELFIDYLVIERQYSTNTIDAYKRDISNFIIYNEGIEIDTKTLNIYLENLRDSYANNTYLRKVSALKNFYKYLYQEEITNTNYLKDLETSKKKIDIPKYLTTKDINKFLNSLTYDTPIELRNKAMLELLYATGMRISELINIKFSDIKLNEKLIIVMGKGKKQRIVPINNTALKYVKMYIDISYPKLNRYNSEYLFLSKNFKPITRQGFYKVVKQKAMLINIDNITPHTFRHSIATHMLNNGANLKVVQEILGHQNLSTTEIYAKLNNKTITKEYKKFHPLEKRK